MRKRAYFFTTGVAVLAAAASIQWLGTAAKATRAHSEPARSAGPASNAPEKELQNLKLELARLRGDVGAVQAEAALARLAKSEPSAAPPLPTATPPSREEQEVSWRAHTAEVNQAFEREPANPGWAAAMQTKIASAVAAVAQIAPNLAKNVECRSRTCKVELNDAARVPRERALSRLVHELGSELPNVTFGHEGDLSDPKVSCLYFSLADPQDDTPLVARQ